MQNADDAGATEVATYIENNYFNFEHNGEDFNKDQLQSLCRFAFSNKRNLHTIGFRGVGFKSTFSLGDVVQIYTPSLSFEFHRSRFTEPKWINNRNFENKTRIRVKITDNERLKELEKNLHDWVTSPVSLLFFKNILQITIQEHVVEKNVISQGPLPDSEVITLSKLPDDLILLIHSELEHFPDECDKEIRQERDADDLELPPCKIDLVLGARKNSRLFVVLPTDVFVHLPFSINAPFLQDTARIKIKELSLSPTNRWLLKRAGSLAGEAMQKWLLNKDLIIQERVKAYDLIPDTCLDEDAGVLDQECAQTVIDSFISVLDTNKILINQEGDCVEAGNCSAPPREIYHVWDDAQIKSIFKPQQNILACDVTEEHRARLSERGWLEATTDDEFMNLLSGENLPPKPASWGLLSKLWDYVSGHFEHRWYARQVIKNLNIIPVENVDILFCADDVVRLSVGEGALKSEDWDFISNKLCIIDRNWITYLFPQIIGKTKNQTSAIPKRSEASRELLKDLGFERATSDDVVVLNAYQRLIRESDTISHSELIRLTHIIAALDATVPETFQYETRDTCLRTVEDGLALDPDCELELLLPYDYAQQHLIHEDYMHGTISCTAAEWREWCLSDKSKLRTFVGIKQISRDIYGYDKLGLALKERSSEMPEEFSIKSPIFRLEDYDFDPKIINFWNQGDQNGVEAWCKTFDLIARDPQNNWENLIEASLYQEGHSISHRLSCGFIPANWIMKLREKPCVRDTYGIPRVPAELLLRTPETEALIDIESFVASDLDTNDLRSLLLLIGCRDSPSGADSIIERIRTFSGQKEFPLLEISKWYQRLDRLVSRGDHETITEVIEIFNTESLILSENREWCRTREIFRSSGDEQIPGILILHPDVRHLRLWDVIGVPEHATADLAINWLNEIAIGSELTTDQIKRVRVILKRYPARVWHECGAWLTISGVWVPIDDLKYKLSMQSLVKWKNLFPHVKSQIADFQMLTAEECEFVSFAEIADLGKVMTFRRVKSSGSYHEGETKDWITCLGRNISRIEVGNKEKEIEIQALGENMARTKLQTCQEINIVPYIENTPVGEPFSARVVWEENHLCAIHDTEAKLFKDVCQELGRFFDMKEIVDAIQACYGRSNEFINEYMDDQFRLYPESVADVTQQNIEYRDENNVNTTVENEESVERNEGQEQPHENDESEIDSEAEVDDMLNEEIVTVEPKTRHKSPSIFDILMHQYGYRKNPVDQRYEHENGEWIERTQLPFHWAHFSSNGEIMCKYWVTASSLKGSGLEMTSEVWELIKQYKQEVKIVVEGPDGNPLDIAGNRLVDDVEEGRIKLFPSKYRIRESD